MHLLPLTVLCLAMSIAPAALATTFQVRLPYSGLKLTGTPTATQPPAATPKLEFQTASGQTVSQLEFPRTTPGAASAPLTVRILNYGENEVTVDASSIAVSAPFSVAQSSCSAAPIPVNGHCEVSLVFSPLTEQVYREVNLVVTVEGTTIANLPLLGVGAPKLASVFSIEHARAQKGVFASSLTTDASGNFYIGGTSNNDGTDATLLKLSPTLVLQWQRTISESVGGFAGLSVDAAGRLQAASRVTNTSLYNYAAAALRTTMGTDGNLVKAQITRGHQWSAVVSDAVGNTYMAGQEGPRSSTHSNSLVAKFDATGNAVWMRSTGLLTEGYSQAFGLALAPSGDLYVVGMTTGNPYASRDEAGFIAKYSVSGSLLWWKGLRQGTDYSTGWGQFNGVYVDASGVYVAGYTPFQQGTDITLAKLDHSGNVIFTRTLGGSARDIATAITGDGQGGIYLVGESSSAGSGGADAIVAKYDGTDGTLLWQRTLGGTLADSAAAAKVVGDYLYIVGRTYRASAQSAMLLAKVPLDGTGADVYGHLTYKESALSQTFNAMTEVPLPMWKIADFAPESSTAQYLSGGVPLLATPQQ